MSERKAETPYLETEALLAVLNDDAERLEEVLGLMTDSEKAGLYNATNKIQQAIRQLLARSSVAAPPPLGGGGGGSMSNYWANKSHPLHRWSFTGTEVPWLRAGEEGGRVVCVRCTNCNVLLMRASGTELPTHLAQNPAGMSGGSCRSCGREARIRYAALLAALEAEPEREEVEVRL